MLHKEAELGSAKAAGRLNQLYCLSSLSTCSIEEVAAVSEGPMLFELDLRLPKSIRDDLIRRVNAHEQFKGIVINAQYSSDRISEEEWKHDFQLPPYLKIGSLESYRQEHVVSNCLKTAYGFARDAVKIDHKDLKDIKQRTRGRLVVKGIMCLEDALAALEFGADDIWISNGARTMPTAIDVLPAIA